MKASSNKLKQDELYELNARALKTLLELVTPAGIYASSDQGWSGPYHSWFGRDGAITTDLVCAALEHGGDHKLAEVARQALLSFSSWQGKKDDIETGEEKGKFPHEIRNTFNEIDRVQHAIGTNRKPWYIDPEDGIMKNWDSADSTPLWIIATIRVHECLNKPLERATLESLRLGLEWIMNNLKTYDGFLGFTGADEIPDRKYSGLHNQGWKDSFQIYQTANGELAPHPIKDVLVNAEAWAALKYGARAFAIIDDDFSRQLGDSADRLKSLFNSKDGFYNADEAYYAQAIDGSNTQLRQIAADPAMCLWAYFDHDTIIDKQRRAQVVSRVTRPGMFNPIAGIRNYEVGTVFKQQGTHYHGTSSTYWPFVSALIARGCEQFSYESESREIIKAYLRGVMYLGSNVELFIQTPDGQLTTWQHPLVGQQSAVEQAWTAAGVYYGTLALLNKNDAL